MAFDKNFKTFVIHVAIIEAEVSIYPLQAAQIAILPQDKIPTKFLFQYFDYANVFFSDLAIKLLKNISINEYGIKLVEDKKPSYRSIYALSLVESEILKTYLKIYLKTRFIHPSKSSVNIFLGFEKKLDGSLCLCDNY